MGHVFSSAHTIAGYLHTLKEGISPVRLHKTLYFLFAYYGALYGTEGKEGVNEGSIPSPKYLFPVQFESWKYGPVIREVYLKQKEEGYSAEEIAESVTKVEQNPEIKQFIDELWQQMNQVSEFSLIGRSMQDDSWRESYNGEPGFIDNERLIKEYTEKYM